MYGRRITLFKLFGFAVRADASWLIIAVLITWSLAVEVFPRLYPSLVWPGYWAMGVLGALLLFVSIVLHELAHSLVARRHGLPIKGITLFVFGGVAEMESEPPSPKTEFLMAVAGPLTSIAIGGGFYGLAWVGRGVWPLIAERVITCLAWINWILAAFNLIPAFPLDGGRILRSALWHWTGNLWRATRVACKIGPGFGILLIAFGVYRLLVTDFIGAVWWFLIGMFLRDAAQNSYRQQTIQRMLQGKPIRRFMNTQPISVSPALSLKEVVEE